MRKAGVSGCKDCPSCHRALHSEARRTPGRASLSPAPTKLAHLVIAPDPSEGDVALVDQVLGESLSVEPRELDVVEGPVELNSLSGLDLRCGRVSDSLRGEEVEGCEGGER